MSGLKNLQTRMSYRGGANQQDRMIADKLASLKSALMASYQSATVIIRNTKDENGIPVAREFKALINPNKVTMALDDKILSIPFEDIRLNAERAGKKSENLEPIGVKVGDIIEWKDTHTYWIVYDQYLQELAYFRGQMRQCESEPLVIDGQSYYYYLKGPDEKGINWQKSSHFILNDLNYNVEMYISKTTESNQFFQRFTKIKIQDKTFEVQAVDRLSSSGLLTVYLKEDYSNPWEPEDTPSAPEIPEEEDSAHISGPIMVKPFDIVTYVVKGAASGTWSVKAKANILKVKNMNDTSVTVEIITGYTGSFILKYGDDLSLPVEIVSL